MIPEAVSILKKHFHHKVHEGHEVKPDYFLRYFYASLRDLRELCGERLGV
jgi:hypothetical protein